MMGGGLWGCAPLDRDYNSALGLQAGMEAPELRCSSVPGSVAHRRRAVDVEQP